MVDQGIMQVAQHRPPLQAARLHHGQQPLHEATTGFTLTAISVLPPQHAAAQQPLRVVVRRLDALIYGGCGYWQSGK